MVSLNPLLQKQIGKEGFLAHLHLKSHPCELSPDEKSLSRCALMSLRTDWGAVRSELHDLWCRGASLLPESALGLTETLVEDVQYFLEEAYRIYLAETDASEQFVDARRTAINQQVDVNDIYSLDKLPRPEWLVQFLSCRALDKALDRPTELQYLRQHYGL
jgi:hypothetical protein